MRAIVCMRVMHDRTVRKQIKAKRNTGVGGRGGGKAAVFRLGVRWRGGGLFSLTRVRVE